MYSLSKGFGVSGEYTSRTEAFAPLSGGGRGKNRRRGAIAVALGELLGERLGCIGEHDLQSVVLAGV